MSKYSILLIGILMGSLITTLTFKKGRENMSIALSEKRARAEARDRVEEELKSRIYTINLERDEEINVWIATSDDVPGLVLQSESLNDIKKQVKVSVPQLLRLNKGIMVKNFSLNFQYHEIAEVVTA